MDARYTFKIYRMAHGGYQALIMKNNIPQPVKFDGKNAKILREKCVKFCAQFGLGA